MSRGRLERLAARLVPRVWGATDLAPWFEGGGERIGEVWFEASADDPLLIKFLFTEDRLSVQVHPNDQQAREAGLPRGKTEMWHVLRAAPGASIAVGFRETLGTERVREAAQSGEIVELLRWMPVEAGDTVYVPAGTVHAMGPGLAVCEIQQNSDTTYRLYDYGRMRELHLDQGLAVAACGPTPDAVLGPAPGPGWRRLATSDYFVTDQMTTAEPVDVAGRREQFVIFTAGHGTISGEPYHAGQCWRVEDGASILPLEQTHLLRTAVPA